MTQIIDSYSESNQSSGVPLYSGSWTSFGQSFTGAGGALASAVFYFRKFGSPTGNIIAKVYSHSGTFGTSSVPNALLATSDNVDVSTLSPSPTYGLKAFTFSGAEQITLVAGTKYCTVVEYTGGDGSNYPVVGYDGSSPTHAGNSAFYPQVGAWLADASIDACFYVYDNTNPSPSLSLSATPSSSVSLSQSVTPSSSVSLSPSSSQSPSGSVSLSPSSSQSPSSSISPSSSASLTPSSSISPSSSFSATSSVSPSRSEYDDLYDLKSTSYTNKYTEWDRTHNNMAGSGHED